MKIFMVLCLCFCPCLYCMSLEEYIDKRHDQVLICLESAKGERDYGPRYYYFLGAYHELGELKALMKLDKELNR